MKLDNTYYFCYNPRLAKYLRYDCNLPFITKAKHIDTNNKFWLFEQTEELTKAIHTYKEIYKDNNV